MGTILDDETDWSELGETVRPFFSSMFLDSPVLLTPRSTFVINSAKVLSLGGPSIIADRSKDYKKLSYKERDAWALLKLWGDRPVPEVLDPDEYPQWISLPLKSKQATILGRAECTAQDLSSLAHKAWSTWLSNKPTGSDPLPEWITSRMTGLEREYYGKWLSYDEPITAVSKMYGAKKHRAVKYPFGSGGFIVTDLSIAMIHNPSWPPSFRSRLLTWDQFLMFKDCMYTRGQVLTGCRVLHPEEALLSPLVIQHFKWQEKCLTRYGNRGYEILKQTESLAKAYLSVIARDEFGEDGPYKRMVEKVRGKEKGYGASDKTGFLCDEYHIILSQCKGVASVVELFGIQKMTGHPLIDSRKGGRVVADVARSPDPTHPADAEAVKWSFCAMFLEHYVSSQGWPHLDFEDKTTKLYQLYIKRVRDIPRSAYPLSDWATCKYGKVFDFDFAPNYLELMDDKAISQYRTNIAANWDSKIPMISHRRLLVELISRGEISAREIVYRVMRRDIPFDWLIICLYPKEKELKIDPRMFSMLVFEMRLFFTLSESNIASSVFKFLPEQTMTDSRSETMTRFLKMTEPRRVGDNLTLFAEIDLSKWNSCWRELVVHKVGDTLDELFGLPGVYTFAHEFYEACMMVVRTREDIPDDIHSPNPIESDLLWYNHLGGTEGIIQKHWTTITLAIIYGALRNMPFSWTLSGQGDNQVLSIAFKSDGVRSHKEQLTEVRDTVLDLITKEFAKVNQTVKPEECLESTRVITYSKDVFVNGVYYPTSLKFHSRLFPQCAQDFPSVRTAIGAIFSTALAGAERTHTPIRSLHLAYLQAAIYLIRLLSGEGIYGERVQRLLRTSSEPAVDQFVSFLLLVPSDLGGFPIATWTDFVYKGGSDPLSKSLAALIHLRAGGGSRLADRILAQLDDESWFQKDPDVLSLMKDPYSIPLKKPVTPIEGITHETLINLRPHIKTKEIAQITSSSTEEYLTKLKAALATAEPFNPLIMRDILDCSVHGIVDTLSRMFVATRTLQSVARVTGSGLVPKLLHLEVSGFEYLLRRFRGLPSSPWRVKTCYQLAEGLRERWKTETTPVPVGLTTHLPFDCNVYSGPDQMTKIGIHAVLTTDKETALNTRGRFFPYISGKTREKRSEHGYRIINTDTTSQAFRKLQLISSQAGGDPCLRTLIDLVGLSRSNTILSEISPLLTSIYGGTFTHRYAARVGIQEASLLGAPNFPSHCMISSDKSGRLSGGVVDYAIMFPEFFLAGLWGLREIQSLRGNPDRVLRFDTDALDLSPLPDVAIKIDPNTEVPLIRFPGNDLVFVPDIKIQALPGSTRLPQLGMVGTLQGVSITTPRDVILVVEAWARSTLRDSSLGRLSVDKGSDLFSTATIDIAEIISCGVSRIVDAFANVVADEFISLAIWTQWTGVDRWRTFPAILKLSSTLSSTLSTQVTHPLLRRDRGVLSMRLFDRPTYSEANSMPHARLTAEIARLALARVEGADYSYLTRAILLTDEGGTGKPSEVIFSVLARIIRYHWAMGDVSAKHCRQIMDRQVRPTLRSKYGEADKVVRLNAAVATIRSWAQQSRLGLLAAHLSDLMDGRLTVRTPLSSKEALRLTRSVVIHETMVSNLLTFTPRVALHTTVDLQINCHPITGSRGGNGPGVTSELDSIYISPSMVIVSKMRRHCEGRGTTGQLSVIRWEWLGELVNNKRVLVVGSGLGGAALACIRLGAVHVVGLDLQSSIPMRPHRFVDYIPPLVLEGQAEGKYTQDPLTFISSGDWYDPSVSRGFLENDSGDDVIIIDIEGDQGSDPSELWSPIKDRGSKGLLIVRFNTTLAGVRHLYGRLCAGGSRFRVVACEGTEGVFPVCFLFEGPPTTKGSTLEYVVSRLPHVTIYDRPPGQDGQVGPLTAACRHLINLDDVQDPGVALTYLTWLYRSSLGEYQSRLGYRKWTDVLWALSGLWWICLPAEKRVPWILEGRLTGIGIVLVGGQSVQIQWTPAFENHLTKVCASALRLTDLEGKRNDGK